MKVGDLARFKCPTTRDENKVFLVLEVSDRGLESPNCWARLEGDWKGAMAGWCSTRDLEVISESR